jgi:hypothetical protein
MTFPRRSADDSTNCAVPHLPALPLDVAELEKSAKNCTCPATAAVQPANAAAPTVRARAADKGVAAVVFVAREAAAKTTA